MNLDFAILNLNGFLFYSIYTSYGYFITSDETGQVDINDIVFAYHSLFANSICILQACVFPRGKNKVHTPTIILLLMMWTFTVIYGTLTTVFHIFISRNFTLFKWMVSWEQSVSWVTLKLWLQIWNICLKFTGIISGSPQKVGLFLVFWRIWQGVFVPLLRC